MVIILIVTNHVFHLIARNQHLVLRIFKLGLLLSLWLTFTILLSLFQSDDSNHGGPTHKHTKDASEPNVLAVVIGGIVLLLLYVFIVFDLVHRTVAAMMATTMTLGVLAAFGDRQSMKQIMGYVDFDTILLLFSMMLLVAMLVPSGLFDYAAVLAYKVRLINTREKSVDIIHIDCSRCVLESMIDREGLILQIFY